MLPGGRLTQHRLSNWVIRRIFCVISVMEVRRCNSWSRPTAWSDLTSRPSFCIIQIALRASDPVNIPQADPGFCKVIDNAADRLCHDSRGSASSSPRSASPCAVHLLSMTVPSETAPAVAHRPVRRDSISSRRYTARRDELRLPGLRLDPTGTGAPGLHHAALNLVARHTACRPAPVATRRQPSGPADDKLYLHPGRRAVSMSGLAYWRRRFIGLGQD